MISLTSILSSTDLFSFISYADDTNLFTSLNNVSSVIINNELNKVQKWLTANKLTLNVNKTKYIVFHSSKKNINHIIPQIILNFLGITLDENLSWNSHINKYQ